MYASPDETLAALERVGYFTDQKTATTVYLAGNLHRPIMLEGPAGAGKTELAMSVSRAFGVDPFHPQDWPRSGDIDTIRLSDVEPRATFRRPPSPPQLLPRG